MRVKGMFKLNRKGMSLIEVIVAIAILAVVIVPTLRIFASTAGTNFRSRQRQRATSVAEGTMETLKAYSMSEICSQFENSNFKGIVPSASTAMTVSAYKSGVHVPVFKDDNTWNREADTFEFHVTDAASEGQLYNVDITATARLAPNVMRIESPNKYSDAVIELNEDMAYTMRDKMKAEAESEVEDNFASYHPGATSVSVDSTSTELSDFTRVIDLTVNDSGGKQTVKVEITYTAKADVSYSYMVGDVPHTGASKSFDETLLTYKQDFSGDGSGVYEWIAYDNTYTIGGDEELYPGSLRKNYKLDQIMLFYFPCYSVGSAFGTGARDEINIKGTLSGIYKPSTSTDPEMYGCEALQVIVAKQFSTRISGVDLIQGDAFYNPNVNCSVSGGGEADLKHNLEEPFATSGTLSPSVTGFTNEAELKSADVDRVILLYDVDIKVYESGNPTRVVAEFIGTMNE